MNILEFPRHVRECRNPIVKRDTDLDAFYERMYARKPDVTYIGKPLVLAHQLLRAA